MSQAARKRILFVAEAVTLAHVARPLALAQSLDSTHYDVHFACANRFDFAFETTRFRRWEVHSISSEQFLQLLATGSRLYDFKTLNDYVSEDLCLIPEIRPDLIVGDFRLSLAVSAAIAKVPYAALANAYWSPYAAVPHFPLPDVPASRLLGYRLSSSLFHLCQPLIFAYHARPLNQMRKKYGLPGLGSLLHVYTHGDYTLYTDPRDLFPTANLPPNHRVLGHVEWSPAIPLPRWWNDIGSDQPVIYVNLGSSGPTHLLPMITATLAGFPMKVIMATAGRWHTTSLPANIKASSYLPGSAAVRRANLVICNGGSPSVYQALAYGVPVVGIASNMDQLLCMQGVERKKAGVLLRASSVTEASLKAVVTVMATDKTYEKNALLLRDQFTRIDALQRFRSFVSEVLKPT